MNGRRLAQIALLTVVALTLVLVFRPRQEEGSASTSQGAEATGTTYVAYYFHGDVRCDTCRSIEAQAEAAVREGFTGELGSGVLTWQVVNTDQPENAHFVDDFALTHGTVVLAEREDGAMRRFVALDRVWELVHDDGDEFRDYVQGAVADWVRSGS